MCLDCSITSPRSASAVERTRFNGRGNESHETEELSSGGDTKMKPMIWIGILLIVLGAMVLAYQGINYTREKKVLDVGSVHLTAETHERIPLPPILGGLALAGSSYWSWGQGPSQSQD